MCIYIYIFFVSCTEIFFCFTALFQSLLFEACGRTVNPVNGAVGLLWTGNWHVCQAAVETVLRGGTLRPMPELLGGGGGGGATTPTAAPDEASEAEVTCTDIMKLRDPNSSSRFSTSRSRLSPKRKRSDSPAKVRNTADLDLRLTPIFPAKHACRKTELRRPGTPSMNSEESVTTTCFESGLADQQHGGGERKLLNLFV